MPVDAIIFFVLGGYKSYGRNIVVVERKDGRYIITVHGEDGKFIRFFEPKVIWV